MASVQLPSVTAAGASHLGPLGAEGCGRIRCSTACGTAWARRTAIGHNRADNGVVTLVLPDGVPAEALIAGEATAAAKGKAKAVTDGAPAA